MSVEVVRSDKGLLSNIILGVGDQDGDALLMPRYSQGLMTIMEKTSNCLLGAE